MATKIPPGPPAPSNLQHRSQALHFRFNLGFRTLERYSCTDFILSFCAFYNKLIQRHSPENTFVVMWG